MAFSIYTTIQGERWDTIAYKAYGDPLRSIDIMDANPDVDLYEVFPGGIKLNIPIFDGNELPVIDVALLPPWKI